MNFSNLTTDYDGTLAEDGIVAESTIKALESLRRSGRSIILITGRELAQLLEIFDRTDLFDWIVAENGALLYHPATRRKHLLTEPASLHFVEELQKRWVSPISIGEAIARVAVWMRALRTDQHAVRPAATDLDFLFPLAREVAPLAESMQHAPYAQFGQGT